MPYSPYLARTETKAEAVARLEAEGFHLWRSGFPDLAKAKWTWAFRLSLL